MKNDLETVRHNHYLFFAFLTGTGSGLFIALILLGLLLANAADWLVLDNEPVAADIGVVLGGGGGSRLRRAISMYNERFVDELLLVGSKESNWDYITSHLCPDCDLTGKKVTIIGGSSTTVTDARLSLHYCRKHGIKSILVITDPYHTRRTALIFSRIFRNSEIAIRVLSSGDYGDLLSPDEHWWQDSKTLELIWLELGKCLAVLPAWHTIGLTL